MDLREAPLELLRANVVRVGEILLESGIFELFNGEQYSVNDLRVQAVHDAITSQSAIEELRRATWLKLRLGRSSGATPIKTVTAIAKVLGCQWEKSRPRVDGVPTYHYAITLRPS